MNRYRILLSLIFVFALSLTSMAQILLVRQGDMYYHYDLQQYDKLTIDDSYIDGWTLVLTLEDEDGQKIELKGIDNPVVTFTAGNVLLESDVLSTSVAIGKGVKCSFRMERSTAIDNVSATRIIFGGGTLQLCSAAAATPVLLYDASGVLLAQELTDQQGNATLQLPTMPGSLYVVKVGNKTFKFTNR